MPSYFTDKNGKVWEFDNDRAGQEAGLEPATDEDILRHNEQVDYEAKSLAGKAGDIATAAGQGVARAAMAPGMALQYALTGDEQALQSKRPEDSAFEESVFSPEAVARKERHGFTAGVAEAVPSILGAGVTAGAGAAPLALAGGLLGESALSGLSQEAVDSVTQQRDFSATAALMNGGVDLALSAATLGLGKGLGRLARRARGAAAAGAEAAEAGAESGVRAAGEAATDAGLPRRNFIAELDPGEVPEAIGAGKRGGPRRSVGAAGAAPERMPAAEVEHFLRNEDDIVEQMRTVAGAKEAGEKGAFQEFNDAFREVTNNRVKRADFAAAAPTDEVTRAALMAERDAVAESLQGVSTALDGRGAKNKAGLIGKHLEALRTAPVEEIASVLDRTKQALDDLHMKAIVDKTDPYGEMLEAVDPVVERIRGALENPKYVGDKIAELQQVRNSAWSDPDSGFIRNMEIANQTGVNLFKKVGRDYKTGDLVMQFDPRAFEQLISLDAHNSKPVLEAWAKVLDSAERMAANTAEAGVASAKGAGREKLLDSIEAIREVFTTQDKRLAAKDLARPGQQLLARAENLPGVGQAVKTAKAVLGPERVESFVAGRASDRLPLPDRSVKSARDALRRLTAPERGAPGAPVPRTPGGPPSGPPPSSGAMGMVPPAAGPANDDAGMLGALRGQGGKVAGVGGLVGAGALLASGEAGAAELPEQTQARAAMQAQLAGADPGTVDTQIRTAEAFARINQRVDTRVKTAVTDLFAIAKDPRAPPPSRSPEARAIDRRARELDVPRAVARFMGRRDDPVQAWQDKRDLLTSVVADPALLASRMAENMGDLPTQQPEIFAKMVGKTMATVEYLHDKLPGAAGKSALDPGGFPPSFEEITEFSGHWVGALYPLDSLDDLSTNELLPEQMEAVQTLWPEGYARFQAAALEQIHALSQERGAIPLEALEQIDSALDLDGAGEPALSSAMAGLIRQAEQSEQQRIQQDAAKMPPPPGPQVSKGPERLASSALGSIHGAGV